jgi:hypothetical protein
VADFPAIDDEFWKGYLHVNETKYCNVYPDTWAPALRDVARELHSPEFVSYLEELTGITGLIPDWSMDGGGLHQTLRGGHLNIHADFTTHHVHENWAGGSTSCCTSTRSGTTTGAGSSSSGTRR